MSSRHAFLLLIVALLLAGCTPTAPAPAAAPATAGDAAALHTLVAIQGQAAVKRQGWSQYAPVFFGAGVRLGDLLRLEGDAKVTLVCADLSTASASAGVVGLPCKAAQPLLTYAGSVINAMRADVPLDVPQIVAPRKTKVLSRQPHLRWLPVGDGASYTVKVQGPAVKWQTEVTGISEMVYPADAPALAAGATYKLTVEANGRSSELEDAPGLGFTVIADDEAQAVRAAEKKIGEMGLADAPTRLLLARLYVSHGLNAEAIEALRASPAVTDEPALLLMLSDLYLEAGVNRLAEEGYAGALALAEGVGDIESQAAAQRALGLLAEARGNQQEAADHLQAALTIYDRLGDAQTAGQLRERMDALEK